MGEAEDGPPGSVELIGSAGGGRCTGQVSTLGFRPPRWVRGRCGTGGPPGLSAGAGRRGAGRARGASFGGSFALDSALTETGEAPVPERSAGGFGGLPFSLGVASETLSRNARATFCFCRGGNLGGGSSAQLGRWRFVGYSGSPVRAGAGRRRTTEIPVALLVSAPLGNLSQESGRPGVLCSVPRILECIILAVWNRGRFVRPC